MFTGSVCKFMELKVRRDNQIISHNYCIRQVRSFQTQPFFYQAQALMETICLGKMHLIN